MSDVYGARLMAGFTKLFSTIVHSTVWREEMHVKVVWVTMLALANRNGIVEVSVPGLADVSRVTVDQCREALIRLASPDPDSRTKEHEGRRIAECDGGWQILNYMKYRELQVKDEQRIKNRIRVAAHRARKRDAVTVTESTRSNDIAEAEDILIPIHNGLIERTVSSNPFVGPGERPKLESEALRLTREIAELMGKDPVEVFQAAAHYEGAKRQKVNPSSMTDDRLLNTVTDLRSILKREQNKKAVENKYLAPRQS
jgi:hypothetical protein